ASAAAHALGLSIADIQLGLQTFHPTPGQNPGRTNLIDAGGVKVLIDYGHNVPALEALSELVSRIPAQRRIGVASAPGNRRDEDLVALGAMLAHMHDVVFLCETAPRGRPEGETIELLREGAASVPNACRIETVMQEADAVDRALDEAAEGDLLVLLVDDVDAVTERLRGQRFEPPASSNGGAGAHP
ncbi:cyanophycin synthetase, partial [Chromohalobacter sp.]